MKVSVCMITYNHEQFIAQAIESVMTQETNLEYELVVGEDCSTDRTRDICIAYKEQYPNKIRLLLREKNLGMLQNFAQTFYACTGQYVALLDGDDYWISPNKLQKQVDFLDAHPDYAVCFTSTLFFAEDRSREPYYWPPAEYQKDMFIIEDLLRINPIATCSVMFRSGLFGRFPDWYFSLKIGDWPLHIMCAQHGKVGYIHEAMAVYRVHAGGIHTSRSYLEKLLDQVNFYEAINLHLNFEYDILISEMQARAYNNICIQYLIGRDTAKARHYALQNIRSLPLRAYFSKKGATLFWLTFKAILYLVLPRPLLSALNRVRRLVIWSESYLKEIHSVLSRQNQRNIRENK